MENEQIFYIISAGLSTFPGEYLKLLFHLFLIGFRTVMGNWARLGDSWLDREFPYDMKRGLLKRQFLSKLYPKVPRVLGYGHSFITRSCTQFSIRSFVRLPQFNELRSYVIRPLALP